MSFIVIVVTLVSLYTRLSAHQIVHNRRARFSQEKKQKSTIMVAFGRGSQTAPGVVWSAARFVCIALVILHLSR